MALPLRWALTGIPANASPAEEVTLPARSEEPSAANTTGGAKAQAVAMAAVNAVPMQRLAFIVMTPSDGLGRRSNMRLLQFEDDTPCAEGCKNSGPENLRKGRALQRVARNGKAVPRSSRATKS